MKHLYWNRHPGKFVLKQTGELVEDIIGSSPGFTGTTDEWNETLIETIEDLRRTTNPHDFEHLSLETTQVVATMLEGSVLTSFLSPTEVFLRYGDAGYNIVVNRNLKEDVVELKLFSGRCVGKVVVLE